MGVMKMLKKIALKVREPGLLYGQHQKFVPRKFGKVSDSNTNEYKFTEEDKKAQQAVEKANNDWSGNVYRYNFVDEDEEAKKAVEKANNDWSGNVYRYNFVDEDEEAKKAV